MLVALVMVTSVLAALIVASWALTAVTASVFWVLCIVHLMFCSLTWTLALTLDEMVFRWVQEKAIAVGMFCF